MYTLLSFALYRSQETCWSRSRIKMYTLLSFALYRPHVGAGAAHQNVFIIECCTL
jgi:hypothetical protein